MRCLLLCALGATLGLASAQAAASLPALNRHRSGESHPGKFEWADLFTSDLDGAERFYTQLFGWSSSRPKRAAGYKAKDSGQHHEYIILSRNGAPVAGLVQRIADPSHRPSRWIPYAAVADLNAAAGAVAEAGGKVVSDPHKVPDRGDQAIVTDSEGAPIGLLQSSSGDLADRQPEDGDWTWFELYASSPRTSANFYRRIFDYEIKPDTESSAPDHYFLVASGRNRAGLAPLPPDTQGAAADWIGFVRVAHLDDALSKVTSLGGEIIAPAKPAQMETRFALVSDPTGGVFGLVEFQAAVPTTP